MFMYLSSATLNNHLTKTHLF